MDFKILFFNKDNKDRFILKKFKDNPSNKLEFKDSLISFRGFNTDNNDFIDLFYKKYLTIFENIKIKNPTEFSTYYWGTKCLCIDFKSSTNEYFKSRGFSPEETKQIRKKKYATSSIKYQMDKHRLTEDDAVNKVKYTQSIIKSKRQSTYKKYIEENPNYWKETVGYGIESLMKNKGLSIEEATELYNSISTNVSEKNKQWALAQMDENPEYWSSRLESQQGYWLNKGYSEDEAIKLVKERQTTFTLAKCIKKHGKEEGTKIFNDRQEKWLKKLYANFEKYGDSRSSQSKWVDDIKEHLISIGFDVPSKEKWIRVKDTTESYSYDLTIENKIIEFNGDYWHMNPEKYNTTDFNKTKQMSAKEIWQYDANKTMLAESHGYKVLTIWESEYKQDKESTYNKCIQFLNN